MKRYCLALDLIDDAELISAYEKYHRQVWPAISRSIREAGILRLDIYRYANRLCMLMEVSEWFSFEAKAASDAADPEVQEWENLMWKYQQALPGAAPGEKWMLMNKIFTL